MITYIKLLWKRFKSKTPKYFKKMINFGIGLGALGGSLILAGDSVPEWLHEPAKYMATTGIVIAACYKTTTTSETLTKQSEELVTKKEK